MTVVGCFKNRNKVGMDTAVQGCAISPGRDATLPHTKPDTSVSDTALPSTSHGVPTLPLGRRQSTFRGPSES